MGITNGPESSLGFEPLLRVAKGLLVLMWPKLQQMRGNSNLLVFFILLAKAMTLGRLSIGGVLSVRRRPERNI